jgi:hypothetical protein
LDQGDQSPVAFLRHDQGAVVKDSLEVGSKSRECGMAGGVRRKSIFFMLKLFSSMDFTGHLLSDQA